MAEEQEDKNKFIGPRERARGQKKAIILSFDHLRKYKQILQNIW